MNEYEVYFTSRAFPTHVSATNPRTAVVRVQANRATAGFPEMIVQRVVQTSEIDPKEWI